MQELGISIQERIKKTKQVIENVVTSDVIRSCREQQKIRCEKENFILAMMRANKVISPSLKKSYLRISEELMKLLQPSFKRNTQQTCQQDFLNDFVHLYTSFFAYFEDKFTFKTKIKNFLRPTNVQSHNLIVDLIKYFVDFTRDYYVQTLFWKMRNSTKNETIPLSDQDILVENTEEGNFTKIKPLSTICRSFSYCNEPVDSNTSPRKKTADQMQQKRNNFKNYQILDVTIQSFSALSPKQYSSNVESLKIKINQLFRDQKSRNGSIKKIYEDYFSTYKEKHNILQNTGPYLSTFKRSDHLNQKCHPLKFLLNIEKSGFSVILIEVDTKKVKNSYLTQANRLSMNSNNTSLSTSPMKLTTQTSLSPLKITQRVTQGQDIPAKGDYFLTSMKVLRVSQNFLPPLFSSNTKLDNNESNSRKGARQNSIKIQVEKQKNPHTLVPFSLKLRKMTNELEEQFPLISDIQQNSQNVLVRSTSFKNSTSQKDKRKLEKYNNELYSGQYVQKQSLNMKMSRKDSQDSNYRISNKKVDIKKKLIQERKSYQSGANSYSKNNHKFSTNQSYESQQKILQWLQKIKNLKEIERRKILGMNY